MMCGSEGEVIQSRIDSCGICGKRVTVNSVLCTKCEQWIHEKCSKLEEGNSFKCGKIFCF